MKHPTDLQAFPNNLQSALTKREYMAVLFMQAILGNPQYSNECFPAMARDAVAAADTLIKRLNNEDLNDKDEIYEKDRI